MKFTNKVVLVNGGSRGIGKEIVTQFALEGAKVVFTYCHSEEAAKDLETVLTQDGLSVQAFKINLLDYEAVEALVQQVIETYGSVDILVNNAGITKDNLLFLMEPADWQQVLDINLNGYFAFAKAVCPVMIRQKRGNIINISSISGIIGVAGQTNYSASKAAIIGFTKSLSKELATKNIRVNAVAPGFIETDMTKDFPTHMREQYIKNIPLKHFGDTKDVAYVVDFLASEKARYITGQVIVVDGGLSV